MSACIRPGPVSGLWMAALTAITLCLAATAGAALGGETGQIAFSRGGNVWTADPDGTDEVQLTTSPEDDRWPRWSPEGNRIAVVRDGDLALLRTTGAVLRVLTSHGDVAGAPSWSPDGRSIAYVRGSGGIAVVEATLAGSNGTRLNLGLVKFLAWSPSGDQIAYTDGGAVFTVQPDGSAAGTEIVPPDPDGRTRDELAWDPQSGQLVFASTGSDGTRVEGSGVALDGAAGDDRSPAWSPDGRRMLFTRGGTVHAYSREGFPSGSNVASLGLVGATPDVQPSLVSSAAAYETSSGAPSPLSFQVRPVGGHPTDVVYVTIPGAGSAEEGVDYSGAAGQMSTPGADGNPASIPIAVAGDAEPEPDEALFVDFTFPSDRAASLRVRGTILNDDGGRNGLITYTGGQGVSTLDPDGGASELIVPSAGAAVFSPSGDRLAYVTGPSPFQVVVADANGIPLVAFPIPAPIDREIAWSADGVRLAWTVGATLWVADRSDPASATAIVTDALTPSWSGDLGPGPRRLAFGRVSTGRVCTVLEDGSGLSCPTTGYQPHWSPDNSTIAFLRGNVTAFLMNPDGTNERLAASATGTVGAGALFRWSPRDGFFALMTGDALSIRQEGGPDTTPSGLPPSLSSFDWSPDGNRLVVQGTSPASPDPHLWIVGPDATGTPFATAREVRGSALDTAYREPRWSLVPPRPRVTLVSHDGFEQLGQARVDVQLGASSPEPVTLTWETVDTGTASPGLDYVPVSDGTIGLQPGETSASILVTLLNDTIHEVDSESFDVRLTAASGARLGPDPQVQVFITDDESTGAPTAAHGTASTTEDTPVVVTLVATDPNGDPLTYSVVRGPTHGSISPVTGDQVTYRPAANYFGPDSFTFKANDGGQDSNVATVAVNVQGANDAPVAMNDVVATPLDTPVDIDVLANDSDPDGDSVTLSAVAAPAHGTATYAGGVVTYTPQAGFASVDHFRYAISDGNGHTATAVVSVYVDLEAPPPPVLTVTPTFLDFGQVPLNKTKDLVLTVTNETAAPVALHQHLRVFQDDPDPFDASDFGGLGCGAVGARILDPGESCTHKVRFWSVPGAEAASPATLLLIDDDMSATLAVVALFGSTGPPDTGPNAPPLPVDDLTGVSPGLTQTLVPLWNDSDPDHDLLRVVAISDPPHGTVAGAAVSCGTLFPLNPNADCIRYVPDTGYVGPDAIVYTVSDGRGGTASATYHLAVGNVVPNVAAVTPSSGPTSGGQAVRITGSNFVYRSEVAFMCGGGVLPLNVMQLTDTEILATTPPGFAGVCALRVRTLFSLTGQLANAYVYTAGANHPPTATNDGPFSLVLGIPLNIVAPGVLANDTDADSNPLTARLVTLPAHGGVSLLATGAFEYIANLSYTGPDSFTYVANDGQADSNVATVSLVVYPQVVVVPDVIETIHVTDDVTVQPAVMIDVAETIAVNDTVTLAVPSLEVSPASGLLGGTTTLRATLTSIGVPVPGKDIVFRLFGAVVTTAATDAAGVATATGVSLAGFAVGSYPGAVQANFAGDATLGAASGSADLLVSGHATSVSLVSSLNPSVAGESVTLTATVQGATGVPQGDVEFSYRLPGVLHPFVLGTVSLDGSGLASFETAELRVGALVVRASYLGSPTFAPGSAVLLQTVTQAPTITTLASSSTNAFTTRPPVFTATVGTAAPWPATGTVEFSADGVSIGRAPVFDRGGVQIAVMGGATLGVGTHTITARYSGDTSHLPSDTGGFTQNVVLGDYLTFDLTPTLTLTDHSEATAINSSDRIVGAIVSASLVGPPRSAGFFYSSGLAPIPSLGGLQTIPADINDAGQVVGWSVTTANARHAFLYQSGQTTDLGTLDGGTSQALAINNAGQIVGTSETASGTHAFLYQAGSLSDLGTLGGPESLASDINASGFAAGFADLAGGSRHASLYTGPWVDLGTLGGTTSRAVAINDAGQIAGTSDLPASDEVHPFLWQNGQLTDLAGPGGPSSTAFALNDAGQVVGWTLDPFPIGSGTPEPRHAFLFSGAFSDLGTLSGGKSLAFDISNAGLLVGVSDGRAFVSSGGSLRDLGTLGGPGSAARAINDRGVIVGAADTASGLRHAVAWLPVPVPTLVVPTATGEVGGTTSLSATLTLFGFPAPNQTIAFTLSGTAVGSATTGATGTATLSGVSLAGLAEGPHPGIVQASYAGSSIFVAGAQATGDVTVTPGPVVIEPVFGGVVSAPRVTINDAGGEQIDPHVDGDLATYSDFDASSVRYYDFATGSDLEIPKAMPGDYDYLSDVSNGSISFSRLSASGTQSAIVFDSATSQIAEIVWPGPTWQTAIGGDTLAFVEGIGNSDIILWNLSSDAQEHHTASPLFLDTSPSVSPDGNTAVWERCSPSFAACDVIAAIRTNGTWLPRDVANTSANETTPDTDGTWIAYGAEDIASPISSEIYFQPVTGGAKTRLDLPGLQRNPSVSRGVISFESKSSGSAPADLFVYVIATNTLYQITDTAPLVEESLNDISVLPNGDIRVVWSANDGFDGRGNVYGLTFTPGVAAPPTAVATGSAALCDGASTPLSGSGGVSCSWAPASGLDDAASCTPVASPSTTTTYTLTVTDAAGLASTNAPTVTVTVNPTPTAVAAGAATITAGQSTPLSGSGGDSCLWSPATGLDDPASCAPNAAPTSTTTYALTVTSAAGCPSTNTATVTVTVLQPQRTLTVTKIGVGTGIVTSVPAGINCGSACTAPFDGGTVVNLTATPNPTFVFGGWTGDADCVDGVVTMDVDKTCTAAFNRRPNLRVSALVAPAVALAGDTFAVNDTTRNASTNGGPAFPAGVLSLYLSTDNVLDTADRVLGGRDLPPLGPNATDSGATLVTIPVGSVGTYWIISKADGTDVVPETNENDNIRVSRIRVGADLRVSALSGLPATAGPGDTITASDTTVNAANAAGAPASATGFYLSADAILGAGDTLLGSRPVGPLAPGGSEAATTPLTVPTGITSGTWYVIAKADFDDRLAELDESDNTRSRPIQIGPPDLLESLLQAPASALAGAGIAVRDIARNDGAGSAGPTTTRLYLSTDATLGPGDTPLASRSVPGLGPGERSDVTTTVVIPAGTAPRSYFLIAVADADAAVVEQDEGNNARSRPFTVR